MLESEIKKLTVAVEALTAQLASGTSVQETDAVTVTQVTTLAKKLINDGAERKAIKEMIKGHGGKLISDLQPTALANLFNELEAM